MTVAFDIKYLKLISQISGIALAQYNDLGIAKADLTNPGFFNSVARQLGKGSIIFAACSDGNEALVVSSIQDGDVALVNLGGGVTEAAKLLLASTIIKTDSGGEIIASLSGTLFASETAAELLTNYTIAMGATDLTITTATLTDANTVAFTCTGTAAAGTISITPKIAACANGIAAVAGTFVIA